MSFLLFVFEYPVKTRIKVELDIPQLLEERSSKDDEKMKNKELL